MTDGQETDRLRKLDERLDALKATQEPGAPPKDYSTAEMGWRMVTELVAGLMIGAGLGYGLDVVLGTLPILLVIFTGLGFAAGVKVMLRTATEMQKRQSELAEEREKG
ncbi:MAG: AtpZ/AtpI family protein [Pseudomonadota bacterium]